MKVSPHCPPVQIISGGSFKKRWAAALFAEKETTALVWQTPFNHTVLRAWRGSARTQRFNFEV